MGRTFVRNLDWPESDQELSYQTQFNAAHPSEQLTELVLADWPTGLVLKVWSWRKLASTCWIPACIDTKLILISVSVAVLFRRKTVSGRLGGSNNLSWQGTRSLVCLRGVACGILYPHVHESPRTSKQSKATQWRNFSAIKDRSQSMTRKKWWRNGFTRIFLQAVSPYKVLKRNGLLYSSQFMETLSSVFPYLQVTRAYFVWQPGVGGVAIREHLPQRDNKGTSDYRTNAHLVWQTGVGGVPIRKRLPQQDTIAPYVALCCVLCVVQSFGCRPFDGDFLHVGSFVHSCGERQVSHSWLVINKDQGT